MTVYAEFLERKVQLDGQDGFESLWLPDFPVNACCKGCGIPLSDGYALGCQVCNDRRATRLRRGETRSLTGYLGEVIDNKDPRGRVIVA